MRADRWMLVALVAVLLTSRLEAQDQIKWQPNLETAQRVAGQTNRLVLLHCWAPWCKACMQLEREVFIQPEFGPALDANFVPVKLNVDDSPATARMYGVASLPTDVILTPTGRLVAQVQSPGAAAQYLAQLNRLAEGHRQLAASYPGAPNSAGAAAGQGAAPPAAAVAAATPQQEAMNTVGSRYPEYNAAAAAAPPAAAVGTPGAQSWQPDARAAAAQPAAAGYEVGGAYSPGQPPAGQPPMMQAPVSQPPMAQAPAYQGAPAQPPIAPQNNYAASPGAGAPAAGATAPSNPSPPSPALSVQLPPGSPPLGLEGWCPVTLGEQHKWVPGNVQHGAIHRGRTYLFTGAEEQKRFMANPDAFSPVLSGVDPVLALDNRVEVPGRRNFGVFFDKRVYLFSSAESLKTFQGNPRRYAAEAVQAMR